MIVSYDVYSAQAVIAKNGTVYVSGQIPLTPAGELVEGDIVKASVRTNERTNDRSSDQRTTDSLARARSKRCRT